MLTSALAWYLLVLFVAALALGLRYRRSQTLLAAGAVALTLAVMEVVLRGTYPPSWRPLEKIPSPEYHHVNYPGAVMYDGRVEGHDIIVRTNDDGFRGDYSREEFLRHRERIAVIGDSFTFGSGVRQEAAFPQVLERLLRERPGHESLAVLNAGTISYSPLLGQRVFDGIVVHYRPSIVLYMLDATDIGDDYNYERELVGAGSDSHFDWTGVEVAPYYGSVGEVVHFAAVLSALARPFEGAPKREYDWYHFRALIGRSFERNRFFIYRHPLEATRTYFDRTWGYIDALARSVRQSGATFELVVSPRFHHWNPQECPDDPEHREYKLNEPYQFEYFRYFDERGAEAPFETLDLLPAFRATDEYPLVFREDPHWNEAGHRFVARVLAAHLLERGLVKS